MEADFIKANYQNLPKVDAIMVGVFLAAEKRSLSIKTFQSSKESYGDDTIGYVQLKRSGKFCTVKCTMCIEYGKQYNITMIVNEIKDSIQSLECQDCNCQESCVHAIAFLFWIHRRTAKPISSSDECYWRPSIVEICKGRKFITAKELGNSRTTPLSSNSSVFTKFVNEAKKRKLNCELLKYQPDCVTSKTETVSMHCLVSKYKEKCCGTFLRNINFTDSLIRYIEKFTRKRQRDNTWYEIIYGRIISSKAYEVSQSKKCDESLIAGIMCGNGFLKASTVKRRLLLKDTVRNIVAAKLTLNSEIRSCGLFLSQKYPMIVGSPDGICEDTIFVIKCPLSENTIKNYIVEGKLSEKYYAQSQILMYLTGAKNCFFCIANFKFSDQKNVTILNVKFNESFVTNLIDVLCKFWKFNVYPKLYKVVI